MTDHGPRSGAPRARFQFVGTDPALEAAGKAYYEYRAELHAAMDRARVRDEVLAACLPSTPPAPPLWAPKPAPRYPADRAPVDVGDILGSSI